MIFSVVSVIFPSCTYLSDHRTFPFISTLTGKLLILLYLIVRSVFDKKEFKRKYIREIKKRRKLLERKEFKSLAQTVFFGFTPVLIELVKSEEYDKILGKYLSYSKY